MLLIRQQFKQYFTAKHKLTDSGQVDNMTRHAFTWTENAVLVNVANHHGAIRKVDILQCSCEDLVTTGIPRGTCEDLAKVLKHVRTDQALATDLAQRAISTARWETRVKNKLLLINGPKVANKPGVFDEGSLPKHDPSGLLQALCPVEPDERIGNDSYLKVKEDFLV